ncbi:sensor histidine kinase [Lutibacter sp. B1]|uniref:sensor histidine kinase n=1 Tax=Lutibacter sp. B1 TaxID=2725996 RepID=UPI0014567445|nr:histidine kinase [Lutibacter sp. B1]NLP58057.1 histidine kinase [Lutibacter sp. B1]
MKKYIDKRLLKILILFYTITSIISFLKIVYLKVNGYGYEFSEWKDIIFEGVILDWLIVIAFMSIIAITTKIMINKKMKWKYIISIHLFFSLFIGVVIYFISSIIYLITGQITFAEIDVRSHFAGIISVIDLNFLIYFSMISIVYSFYYFEKTKKTELEKSQLANQLTNVKMNVLKYKLHPHFLFNTLNSISSLIETDTKLAQNTVADFGDLLRDLLDLKDTNLIPLKEEISIVKRYLDIMSLRYSDHLTVKINFDKKLNKILVPSLILLPIVENSIKHGYSYDFTNLTIELSIIRKDENIVFTIKNNGAPLNTRKKKYGNGLQNTIDRLKILYNNNFTYTMKNVENKKGVITTIKLPIT